MSSIATDNSGSVASGATPDQPVSRKDRLVALDFIRGIAILGILFANITAFGHPMLAYFWPEALPGGGNNTDEWVWLFQYVFVDGKFRGLFSLLFGAGMMLFIERVWARGGSRWLQARRLFWLALFGAAHLYLLWIGDILFLYAISGFVSLAFLKWQAKTQLRVGLIWFAIGSLALSAALASPALIEGIPEVRERAGPEQVGQVEQQWTDMVEDAEAATVAMTAGTYPEVVMHRVRHDSKSLFESVFFSFFETIPLMLIGMGCYRFGFFSGALDKAKMRRWGWIGYVAGAALSVPLGYWAVATGFPPFLTQFIFNGPVQLFHLPMILGMAALLTLWAPAASQSWLGSRLVATGRMAFSNYLGTSFVMMFIFQGWAVGLYGELHRAQLLPIVLLGWVLMLAWSKPWLEHFRYGPLEWLWRCLTYGKIFPIKRERGDSVRGQ